MWQGLSTSRFQLLLLCICYWHGPKHLISFSSYKAWKPPRFVSSQSRTNINLEGVSKKNPTTPNQISYSFKWIFSPELKLFLNPIFSALNIPCLIAGEKKPSFIPTNKVASSLFAQATKLFLCSSHCTRHRLHKELLYLDYIK